MKKKLLSAVCLALGCAFPSCSLLGLSANTTNDPEASARIEALTNDLRPAAPALFAFYRRLQENQRNGVPADKALRETLAAIENLIPTLFILSSAKQP